MYNSFFTACDVCAEVLEGKKGTAEIAKNYITIKGNILYSEFEKKGGEYHYYWAKRKDDHDDLHFCNAECLMAYMLGKKELVDQIKKERVDNEFHY